MRSSSCGRSAAGAPGCAWRPRSCSDSWALAGVWGGWVGCVRMRSAGLQQLRSLVPCATTAAELTTITNEQSPCMHACMYSMHMSMRRLTNQTAASQPPRGHHRSRPAGRTRARPRQSTAPQTGCGSWRRATRAAARRPGPGRAAAAVACESGGSAAGVRMVTARLEDAACGGAFRAAARAHARRRAAHASWRGALAAAYSCQRTWGPAAWGAGAGAARGVRARRERRATWAAPTPRRCAACARARPLDKPLQRKIIAVALSLAVSGPAGELKALCSGWFEAFPAIWSTLEGFQRPGRRQMIDVRYKLAEWGPCSRGAAGLRLRRCRCRRPPHGTLPKSSGLLAPPPLAPGRL